MILNTQKDYSTYKLHNESKIFSIRQLFILQALKIPQKSFREVNHQIYVNSFPLPRKNINIDQMNM